MHAPRSFAVAVLMAAGWTVTQYAERTTSFSCWPPMFPTVKVRAATLGYAAAFSNPRLMGPFAPGRTVGLPLPSWNGPASCSRRP